MCHGASWKKEDRTGDKINYRPIFLFQYLVCLLLCHPCASMLRRDTPKAIILFMRYSSQLHVLEWVAAKDV